MSSILFVHGSPSGASGNSARLAREIEHRLPSSETASHLDLSNQPASHDMTQVVAAADGFVFSTGTYWDSWGSPLQRFLEVMTPTEGSALWLGKPAIVVVSMHSVGGKGVLSRLQGVLNTFGLLIPPMTGFVYAEVAHRLLEREPMDNDLWRREDLEVALHNFLLSLRLGKSWRSWEVDTKNFARSWLD